MLIAQAQEFRWVSDLGVLGVILVCFAFTIFTVFPKWLKHRNDIESMRLKSDQQFRDDLIKSQADTLQTFRVEIQADRRMFQEHFDKSMEASNRKHQELISAIATTCRFRG